MKTRVIALLIILFVVSPALPVSIARADVINVPDNDFYLQNSQACVKLERKFIANGKDGSVALKTKPGSNKIVTSKGNKTELLILYTYDHNGEIWGFADADINGRAGWVPLDQLLLMYDYLSFQQEHQDELHFFDGSMDLFTEADNIVLWTWPGSGKQISKLGQPYKDNMFADAYKLVVCAYTDADGREWGYFNSKYWPHVWVCLSDPSNPDIPAFNPAQEPVLWYPASSHEPASEESAEQVEGMPIPVLIAIMLIAIGVVTIVLIRVRWRKVK